MDKVTHYAYCDFPGYSKCGKNILWLFFLWLFLLLVLWLFILWLFFRLPFMYCIYNISFIDRSWKSVHFQIKLEVIRTQIELLGTRFSERFIIQLLQDISINFVLITFIDQIWQFPTTKFTNYRKLIGIVQDLSRFLCSF